MIDTISRELITKSLSQYGGNRSHAARLLKVPRPVHLYQVKKLGIDG
jgi:DNA-binding NtrC family response regulator